MERPGCSSCLRVLRDVGPILIRKGPRRHHTEMENALEDRAARNRGVEQFDDVEDPIGVAGLAGRRLDLEDAARVRGDDQIRRRVGQDCRLAPTEFGGHRRLRQVEDAGAAAADVALGDGHQREAGDRIE